MKQREVFPFYRECCSILSENYEIIQSYFKDGFVDEICSLRGYIDEHQRNEIERLNLGACNLLASDLTESANKVGLITQTNNYILADRYVIPVYDVAGNLSALIGYYPDIKKYITTPSPYFSKEAMFFNFNEAYKRAWSEYGGRVFLVEGIFDCISMQSIGLPCIATMGANVSSVKGELLKLFKKVVGIPDNDKTGRKSLNRYDRKHGWNVPYGTTMVKLSGECDFGDGDILPIKDCDNLVSWYDADDVREMLLYCFDVKDEIFELHI